MYIREDSLELSEIYACHKTFGIAIVLGIFLVFGEIKLSMILPRALKVCALGTKLPLLIVRGKS